MRNSVFLFCCALGVCRAWSAELPAQEHLHYELSLDHIALGLVDENWTDTSSHYEITSVAKPRELLQLLVPTFTETSSGEVTKEGLVPKQFRHHSTDGKADQTAEFDWGKKIAIVQGSGPSVSVNLPALTQDMQSIKYQSRWFMGNGTQKEINLITGKEVETHQMILKDQPVMVIGQRSIPTHHWVETQDNAPSAIELWLADDSRIPVVQIIVKDGGRSWVQKLVDWNQK